jgi:hypothetical protein
MATLSTKEQKRTATANIRAVEALLRGWDPIHVQPGNDWPADEYDSYAPHIVSLVMNGCTPLELANHLRVLRTEYMEMSEDDARDREVATAIIRAIRAATV